MEQASSSTDFEIPAVFACRLAEKSAGILELVKFSNKEKTEFISSLFLSLVQALELGISFSPAGNLLSSSIFCWFYRYAEQPQ